MEEEIFDTVRNGTVEETMNMLDGGVDPNYKNEVSFPFLFPYLLLFSLFLCLLG